MSLLERINFLHQELTRNRFPNARSLMREFEISQATARRDIAYLRDRLLAPLAFDQKKNGFYYEHEGFNLPFIDNARIVLLLGMLNRLAEETGLRELTELRQLGQRLATMIDQDYGNLGDIMHCEWIEIEHPDPAIFDSAIDAIVGKRQLRITYQSPRHDSTQRVIEPQKLINYQGRWYLFAWCTLRSEPRTFHMARIVSAEKGEKISTPKRFPESYLSGSFGIFKGAPRYHAEILFTGTAAVLVRNQIWHKQQQITEHEQGVVIRLPINDDREIMAKVLQYGSQAQVLGPEQLVEKIASEIKALSNRYS